MYKSVFVSNSIENLSPEVFINAAVFVEGDMEGVYVVEGGAWVKKSIGHSLEASWPVGSVITLTNEKNPADLFGFGKWEEIKGEGKHHQWERIE